MKDTWYLTHEWKMCGAVLSSKSVQSLTLLLEKYLYSIEKGLYPIENSVLNYQHNEELICDAATASQLFKIRLKIKRLAIWIKIYIYMQN